MSPVQQHDQIPSTSSPPQTTRTVKQNIPPANNAIKAADKASIINTTKRSPSKGFSLSSLGRRSSKPSKRVPDLTPQKQKQTDSHMTRGVSLKDDGGVEMAEITLHSTDDDATVPLAKPFALTRSAKVNPETTESKPSQWEKMSNGNFKENGLQLKLVGSKVHTKHMGIYAELDSMYNKAPVYQHRYSEKPYFLYYTDKAWRVSSVVGKKKCIFSTNSPPTRPDKVRSIWYEARGPRLSAMQGHPGIKAILVDEDDCNIIGAAAAPAIKSKGATKAQDRIRRRLTLS